MEQENRENALVVADEGRALVESAPRAGYWARVSRRCKFLARFAAISLLLFVLMFAATCPGAFSYKNVLYFGKDLGNLSALAAKSSDTVYYTYGKEGASVISYRGGVGVVHCGGTEIYAPDGELLLFLAGEYQNPRAAVARDYFITYDFGGKSYTVCNSYVELYRGTTEHPIYHVSVADTGHYAIVTAPEATAIGEKLSLSEVLVFTPSFQLVNRFGRAGATVAATVSDSGNYVAIADATAAGAVVDVFALGTQRQNASLTFADFPYQLSFISDTALALVCEKAAYTFQTDGDLYGKIDYNGDMVCGADMNSDGIALILRHDSVSNIYRFVVTDKKGSVKGEFSHVQVMKDISLSGDRVWLLLADRVMCYSLDDGAFVYEQEISSSAVGVRALNSTTAHVFYPSMTIMVSTKERR